MNMKCCSGGIDLIEAHHKSAYSWEERVLFSPEKHMCDQSMLSGNLSTFRILDLLYVIICCIEHLWFHYKGNREKYDEYSTDRVSADQ